MIMLIEIILTTIKKIFQLIITNKAWILVDKKEEFLILFYVQKLNNNIIL